MNIVADHRGHLPTLHVGHALVRVQDKDIDVATAPAAFDCRRAGIARGGTHDHDLAMFALQDVVEQATQQLQREILERECGAVEQLHDPLAGRNLDQWRYRVVAEFRIGFVENGAQVLLGNTLGDEGTDNLISQFRVGHTRKGGDLLGAEGRELLGNIQAAIGRQSGQQNLLEIQRRRRSPGAYVLHGLPALPVQGLYPDPRNGAGNSVQ